jgi:hypothetical protein
MPPMKSLPLAVLAVCVLAAAGRAQFVPGVVTTTNMGTFSTYNILNLTNGVGLSGSTLAATHSAVWQDMWISNAIVTGWLQFDLGSVQPLAAIAVWNYNSSISYQRGVAQMNVSTSTDALTWSPLSSESLAMADGSALPPHLIAGNGVLARYVRFDVLSNHGNTYTGLSEVQFVAGSGVLGTNTVRGQGCIRKAASFYELFATAAAFDLSNSGLSMIPLGSGSYLVVPASVPFVAPSAAAVPLSLANDAQTTVTLASPFPHATGSTSSLVVCSNGFVSVATGNGTGATPAAATMLNAPQTAWWAWHNYNPAAAGGGVVKFEQLGSTSYVTWDGVWDSGGTSAANASTFQFQFDRASGAVHVVFQTMSALGNGYLVGYSPGGPSTNHGSRDLSVEIPASFLVDSVDQLPLALAGTTRPVLGTPWSFGVSSVPAGGAFGVAIYGLADPGLPDLGALGAPGCGWRASLDFLDPWLVTGATHSYSLPLPVSPALVHLHIYAQALVLQPGVNGLLGGAVLSNGIDGRIGNL